MAVEDGLVSSYAEYQALDERVLMDWRMYRVAAANKAANEANRQTRRSR